MWVIAHGNVDEYCEKHGMRICGRYEGDLERYNLSHPVVVTEGIKEKNEYYYLKYLFMKRGIELVSVNHSDENLEDFLVYLNQRERAVRKSRSGGRVAFGFQRRNGKEYENAASIGIARRIIALRDEGKTLKQISESDEVHYPDGRRMSISTIQVILSNRGKYEKQHD